MRLLVTGASGFIGGNLVRLLQSSKGGGVGVTALSSTPIDGVKTLLTLRGEAGYELPSAALLAEAPFDVVLHLGSWTPRTGAQGNDVEGATSNISATLALMNLVRAPRPRFVFASTVDVYAPSAEPISERSPVGPTTLYGQSKLYCEMMLAAAYASAPDRLKVLRIGHIYGPGEDAYGKVIPVSVKLLLAGEAPRMTTSGDELRSFCYVDSACRAILAVVNGAACPSPINIGASRTASVAQIVQSLCEIHRRHTGQVLFPARRPDAPRGRDVCFDAAAMERCLGRDETPLEAGLEAEYMSLRRGLR